MIDALIIGSGPAGSHAAYLLAKMGYEVMLIEGKKIPKKFINCTGILGLEAFYKFNLWEVPILNRINKIKFISPNAKTFTFKSDSDLAYVVDRICFDTYLRDRATNAGASCMNNSWVNEILIGEDGVRAKILSKNRLVELKARAAVIATGFGSPLIEKMGLENPPEYIEAVQVDVYGSSYNITEVYLGNNVAPGSFAWFVPLSSERALIGLTTKNDGVKHLKKLLNRIKSEKNIAKINNSLCSRLPLDLIPKGYTERVLIAGEAAGQVKTTTNGGIYYGMIGAELAAKVLHKAFQQNSFSEEFLSQYDQLWRAKLDSEIQAGLRLRELYSNLSDLKINLLFSIISMNGIMPLIKKNLNFDWHKELIFSLLNNSLIKRLL